MQVIVSDQEVNRSSFEEDCRKFPEKEFKIETRNGRDWVKWSYSKPLGGLDRLIRIIKAVALTVFTLFLALISKDVRALWSEGLSGKETIFVLNPLVNGKSPAHESPDVVPQPRSRNGELEEVVIGLDDEDMIDSRAGDPLILTGGLAGGSRAEDVDLAEPLEEVSALGAASELQQRMEKIASQRQKITALLRDPGDYRDHFPFEKIKKFLVNCLALHGESPRWAEVRDSCRRLESLELDSDWKKNEVHDLFYNAVSLLKDFKVADKVEKVRAKLFSEIALDPPEYPAAFPVNPGPVQERAVVINDLQAHICSAQGARGEMEDEDLAVSLRVELPTGTIDVPCFAVFDGHGGNACSRFLKEKFAGYMQQELSQQRRLDDLGINNAIKLAFAKANAEFMKTTVDMSGSTATIALVIDGALWVANTGDSRAVLHDGEKAVQLSEDAVPSKAGFKKGIENRGGTVFFGRVGGSLATARAFGDKGIVGVTARPKIRKFDLNSRKRGRQLILACDGLFDYVGSKEAVDAIKGIESPSVAAKYLFDLTFRRGTKDNVTVMVVNLG